MTWPTSWRPLPSSTPEVALSPCCMILEARSLPAPSVVAERLKAAVLKGEPALPTVSGWVLPDLSARYPPRFPAQSDLTRCQPLRLPPKFPTRHPHYLMRGRSLPWHSRYVFPLPHRHCAFRRTGIVATTPAGPPAVPEVEMLIPACTNPSRLRPGSTLWLRSSRCDTRPRCSGSDGMTE